MAEPSTTWIDWRRRSADGRFRSVSTDGGAIGAPDAVVSPSPGSPGAGIPIEVQEQIFEPFVTTKRGRAGLGRRRRLVAHWFRSSTSPDARNTMSSAMFVTRSPIRSR